MKLVSILILTHNAPKYVEETLVTLNQITKPEDLAKAEIIVLDNASDHITKDKLQMLFKKGYIDKIEYSDVNTFFAKGNNLASKMASEESKYYLLLNSDIRINDPDWLNKLIKAKEEGEYAIASYGACKKPYRADGYCFLIDRNLYDKYKLDENFEWWWGITKIQAQILKEGFNILCYKNHDKLIYHYGGKSGKDFLNAKGMNTQGEEVLSWYNQNKGKVVIKSLSVFSQFIQRLFN